MRYFFSFILCLVITALSAQKIADPCFQSIPENGWFYGSDDIKNFCCHNSLGNGFGSDLIEWNGTEWLGSKPYSDITITPPPGSCSNRAIWSGSPGWTYGGEGVALRLDQPLKAGQVYSFTFTYASDGKDSDGNYSPKLYTIVEASGNKSWQQVSSLIGQLPSTKGRGWVTNTMSFTAKPEQQDHSWIVLHAFESSGLLLADCFSSIKEVDFMLGDDQVVCENTEVQLSLSGNDYTSFLWSTGSTEPTIATNEPGIYSVVATNGNCTTSGEVRIDWFDCEVRLDMPNIFTPNDDGLNERFVPISHNYVDQGRLLIFNRWGQSIFEGELFAGWNGEGFTTGVYYFKVYYSGKDKTMHEVNGHVTLTR